MKNLSLVLVLVFLTIGTSEAQVKRQYRNAQSSKTVMVVKELGSEATDLDILNSLDMANVSMSDEIMITTEMKKAVTKNTAEVPSAPKATTAEKPVVKYVRQAPVQKQRVVKVNQPTAKKKTKVSASVSKPVSRTSTSIVSQVSKARADRGYSMNTSVKKKKKNKRVRLKKKKIKTNRKFSACYKF